MNRLFLFNLKVICGSVLFALFFFYPAHATVYDFKLSAGGQKIPQITEAGSYILVAVTRDKSAANVILFIFTSRIPQPVSSLARFLFDTGAHKDLFASMYVQHQIGTDVIPTTNAQHAYFRTFSPDYSFGLSEEGKTGYSLGGLNPGEFLVIAAVLGPGKTIAHVLAALNQGISADPAVARAGLRIGVFVYHLLGKRPDPRRTIMDDAGYVTGSVRSR